MKIRNAIFGLFVLASVLSFHPARVPAAIDLTGWRFPLPRGSWWIYQGPKESLHDCSHPGDRTHCGTWWEDVCAVDIWSPEETQTPILAPADGKVIFAQMRSDTAGRTVKIRHDNDVISTYFHMDQIAVAKDDEVKAGDKLGYMGKSGNPAFSVHLHFVLLKGDGSSSCESIRGLDGYYPPAPDAKNPSAWSYATSTNKPIEAVDRSDARTVERIVNPPAYRWPGDGERFRDVSEVLLKWTPSAYASQYQVEYQSDAGGTKTSAWINDLQYTVNPVSLARFTWRVCARNASGRESDWSPQMSFFVEGTPPAPAQPAKPTLRDPRDGSTASSSDDVTISWNPAQNAMEYKVETWGNTVRGCDWQNGTSCRIGQLPAGIVRWHVKARNASGESDWSDGWSLTIQDTPRIITITPTWTRAPTATSTLTPAASSDRDLQIVGGLSLSNISPRVGDSVTASFRIRNASSRTIIIRQLDAGARGPNARNLNWNAPEVDFPAVFALTLQPGQELDYRQSRTFDAPGDYFAEPVWMDIFGAWAGAWPYPRVWFNVAPRQITLTPTPTRTPTIPSSPGRLVIIGGLSVSNTNPQANQDVNARYRVRNDGGSPITARYLGVKGRHASTNSTYDFFWLENLTLQPGQEYTYDANRGFDRIGSYSLTPNYSDGANWYDIKFANGSSNYVTINVSASQPPTLTPTRPGPTGNLAPRARREPDGINSGNAFDGNLSTFWTNGLGHRFNLRLTLQDAATINRIIVWDRPQNSPDNNQINQLIVTLSNGMNRRFDMNSGGPRCIDVTLSSPQTISWVNLKADDASGNNGLSEVEIWAGSKTSGPNCSNRGNLP